eukprot:8215607-Alexandrium_andersonii.AAC.1
MSLHITADGIEHAFSKPSWASLMAVATVPVARVMDAGAPDGFSTVACPLETLSPGLPVPPFRCRTPQSCKQRTHHIMSLLVQSVGFSTDRKL